MGAVTLTADEAAVGRRTYMPSVIADAIRAHWSDVEDGDRANLLRDLRQEIALADVRDGDRLLTPNYLAEGPFRVVRDNWSVSTWAMLRKVLRTSTHRPSGSLHQ